MDTFPRRPIPQPLLRGPRACLNAGLCMEMNLSLEPGENYGVDLDVCLDSGVPMPGPLSGWMR